MAWRKLFEIDDIQPGERKIVTIEDDDILIIRTTHNVFAITARCPHLNLPLKRGKVSDDDILTCPFHHSQFDLHTGKVKAWSTWPPGIGKAAAMLSKEEPLTTYPVKIEKDILYIDI